MSFDANTIAGTVFNLRCEGIHKPMLTAVLNYIEIRKVEIHESPKQ